MEEQLKAALGQVIADSKEIEQALEAAINDREAKCQELQAQLDAARNGVYINLQKQLHATESHNDELEEKLRIAQSDLTKYIEENQSLLETMSLKESAHAQETDTLRAEVERYRQELLDLQEEIHANAN